jgi:hypothetical protein
MKTQGPVLLLAAFALQILAACGGQAPLPQPRNVIVFSGERIQADPARMQEVERWLRPQLEEIHNNPSFAIRLTRQTEAAYPWDTFGMAGDTVMLRMERAAVDVDTPHLIYGHLRLAASRDELNLWLQGVEADDPQPEGFEQERLILDQVADVWLLGRSVFDTQAYGPLDELLYARERGKLEEFILATQGDRFPEQRDRFSEENPEWEEELRAFFQQTFERDGPGFLPSEPAEETPATSQEPGRS